MARKTVKPTERITRVSIWVKKKHVTKATKEVKVIEDKFKTLA